MTKCESCGTSKKEYEEYEECVECGSLVCSVCIDTSPYGDPICPACYDEDDDNYG